MQLLSGDGASDDCRKGEEEAEETVNGKVEGEGGSLRPEVKEQSGALLDIARIKRLPKLPADHYGGGGGATEEDDFSRKEFQGARGGALDQAFANENGWLPSAVV